MCPRMIVSRQDHRTDWMRTRAGKMNNGGRWLTVAHVLAHTLILCERTVAEGGGKPSDGKTRTGPVSKGLRGLLVPAEVGRLYRWEMRGRSRC